MKHFIFNVWVVMFSIFIFSGCVQTAGQIGTSINDIKEMPVNCLSQSEIDTLLTGKTITGESERGIDNGITFEASYNSDHSKIIKLYKNGRFLKKITGRKWFTKKGGLLCSEEIEKSDCGKICKFENKYHSVKPKNGKITSSWIVKE
jgi:hypothetical protein